MLLIRCPYCGPRAEAEFRYHGDASGKRPQADAPVEAFVRYVYERDNPSGWHSEWWQHVAGCRSVFAIRRNTLTHAMHDREGQRE